MGMMDDWGSSTVGGWMGSMQPTQSYNRPVQRAAVQPMQAAAPVVNANQDQAAIKALSQSTANYQQQFKARYDKLMGLASQFGAAQQQQNADLLRQQQAQGQNSLVSRGLGNSTVVNAVQQNAQGQAQERNAQAADTKTQMQMGVAGDIQPQAPNYQMYSQLLSQPHTGTYAGLLKTMPQFNLFG